MDIYGYFKSIYDPFGFTDRGNEADRRLMAVIEVNERAIQESVELVNSRFGLKLTKPRIITGFELEFTNAMDLNTVKEANRQRAIGLFAEDRHPGNFSQELQKINIQINDDSIIKSKKGEDTFYKHELTTIAPSSIQENYQEYLKLLLLAQEKLGYFEFKRFSAQTNYSIIDEENNNNFPLYNKNFRQLIGANILKFVDEGLPMLDTKESIEKKSGNAITDFGKTDRMDFLDDTSASINRCFYQLAYRNNDRPIPDDYSGPFSSTARLELRRIRPGHSEAGDTVCDQLLVAHALVSSAIRHSFETGIQEHVEPYNYRGGSFRFHLNKMWDSSLLNQYLGEDLVRTIHRNIWQHAERHHLDKHGSLNRDEFWGR